MRGNELRKWRLQVGWKHAELMAELDITSRQTLNTWEKSEKIPRIVELAITALDQIEACRRQSGFESQFTSESIANRRFEALKAANTESGL